jgi:hypothetical protein
MFCSRQVITWRNPKFSTSFCKSHRNYPWRQGALYWDPWDLVAPPYNKLWGLAWNSYGASQLYLLIGMLSPLDKNQGFIPGGPLIIDITCCLILTVGGYRSFEGESWEMGARTNLQCQPHCQAASGPEEYLEEVDSPYWQCHPNSLGLPRMKLGLTALDTLPPALSQSSHSSDMATHPCDPLLL